MIVITILILLEKTEQNIRLMEQIKKITHIFNQYK